MLVTGFLITCPITLGSSIGLLKADNGRPPVHCIYSWHLRLRCAVPPRSVGGQAFNNLTGHQRAAVSRDSAVQPQEIFSSWSVLFEAVVEPASV